MMHVCIRDVMDVVFSVCIVRRRAVGNASFKFTLDGCVVLNAV